MKITDKKALDCINTIQEYCVQQYGCQNCIFRKYAADRWECYINGMDFREVNSNYEAKKKNGGWI